MAISFPVKVHNLILGHLIYYLQYMWKFRKTNSEVIAVSCEEVNWVRNNSVHGGFHLVAKIYQKMSITTNVLLN